MRSCYHQSKTIFLLVLNKTYSQKLKMAACLGGALNQLVSLGLADGVLTSKPKITYANA